MNLRTLQQEYQAHGLHLFKTQRGYAVVIQGVRVAFDTLLQASDYLDIYRDHPKGTTFT